MRSQTDPILLYSWLKIGVLSIGAIALIVSAYWSQSTITPIDLGRISQSGTTADPKAIQTQTEDRPDPSQFSVNLWYTPPTPQSIPAPPKLPRLELLGITSVDGDPAVILFDLDSDSMVTLRVGESHGPTEVTAINTGSVECTAHDRAFTIALGESTP